MVGLRSFLRAAGVVLSGYIAIGVLVMLTDAVVWAIKPHDYVSGQTPPVYYFAVSLITAPLYAVFGGWLSARLSLKPWRDAVALVVFGELMGVASMLMTWSSVPHWYGLGLLLLYPPAVLAGARLHTGRARARSAAG